MKGKKAVRFLSFLIASAVFVSVSGTVCVYAEERKVVIYNGEQIEVTIDGNYVVLPNEERILRDEFTGEFLEPEEVPPSEEELEEGSNSEVNQPGTDQDGCEDVQQPVTDGNENKEENPSNMPLEPVGPDGSAALDVPENPDNSDSLDVPENPDDSDPLDVPENPDISEDPVTSDTSDSPENPGGSQDQDISEEPENPDVSEDLDISEDSREQDDFQEIQLMSEVSSNEELIMKQRLVKLPKIVEDFRFWTVARKYAFAKEDMFIREAVPAGVFSEDAVRIIGKIQKAGLLYILKELDNGWCYVESGRVRGFVKAEEIMTGEEAAGQLENYQRAAKEVARQAEQEYAGIESIAPMAEELIPWNENQAFTYLRATVNQTVIKKDYAIVGENPAEIREDKNSDSRVVGTIPAGGLSYILQDKDQDWIYVESGDVRGFVEKLSIQYGEEVTKQVEEKKESTFVQAEKRIDPKENMACYYTLTSVKSGIPDGELRKSVVEFASQFIGNPYIWGGTSLTNGADCSGFVQSIFKQYGYNLPRVACDQAEYGTKIPVEDALPGDLIFYAKDGYVDHVVMYAGEGRTVEAQSSRTGIVCADVRKDRAVWATRFLKDQDYGYAGGGISDVNATPDMYGTCLGNYQLTYYCACELCCDVETGITATGAPVVEGRTIAVDPEIIPYGTEVIIGGHIFTAEDCGGAIKGNHVDIYVNSHAEAQALGISYADVYLKK